MWQQQRCRRAHLCDSNPTHAVTIMVMEKSVWPGALLAEYMLKVLQNILNEAAGGVLRLPLGDESAIE